MTETVSAPSALGPRSEKHLNVRMALLTGTLVVAASFGLTAAPALADVTYDQPVVGTGCTLHTRVSTTVDPQARPPFNPSGTNVGYTCP